MIHTPSFDPGSKVSAIDTSDGGILLKNFSLGAVDVESANLSPSQQNSDSNRQKAQPSSEALCFELAT